MRCVDRHRARASVSYVSCARVHVLCTKCVVVSVQYGWARAYGFQAFTQNLYSVGVHTPRRHAAASAEPHAQCQSPAAAAAARDCRLAYLHTHTHTHTHTQHTLRLPVKSAHTDTRAHTSLNQRPDIAMLDSERCPLSHTCSARYSARGPSSSRCSVHSPTSCPLTSPCSLK